MFICSCGIKCTIVNVDNVAKYYCPRCNKIVANAGNITECITEPIMMSGVASAQGSYLCDQCGSWMHDACRARCPNCNWEKPCN